MKESVHLCFGNRAAQAASALRERMPALPEAALVLPQALEGILDARAVVWREGYGALPHFPLPADSTQTEPELLLLQQEGAQVAVLLGHDACYAGFTQREACLPLAALAELGIGGLLVSNFALALSPALNTGDLLLVKDHINFTGDSPLIGPNDDEAGPRFPDMSLPYDARWREELKQFGADARLPVREGCLVAVPEAGTLGPETADFLRTLGAEAVTIGVAPEAIWASHRGIPVLGLCPVWGRAPHATGGGEAVGDLITALRALVNTWLVRLP